MNKSLPRLSLIIGGAASGKSAWAENLVEAYEKTKIYIATAQAFDDEMKDRISRHKISRGPGWTTVEAPHSPENALLEAPSEAVVLLDCATLWLSNLMLAGADTQAAQRRLLQAVAAARAPLAVVSNEVGHGVVPDTALGRRFRDVQGRFNIALAARADLVVTVTAGLPHALKGTLP